MAKVSTESKRRHSPPPAPPLSRSLSLSLSELSQFDSRLPTPPANHPRSARYGGAYNAIFPLLSFHSRRRNGADHEGRAGVLRATDAHHLKDNGQLCGNCCRYSGSSMAGKNKSHPKMKSGHTPGPGFINHR